MNMKGTLLAASLLALTAIACPAVAESPDPYGICYHITFMDDGIQMRRDLRIQKQIGISMVRSDLNWPWIPKGKDGKYNYAKIDKCVRILKRNKMKLLPILNQAPPEAQPYHEHLDQWADFVRQTVERYRKDMPYWEVINEHNFTNQGHWGSRELPVHTKHYTQLLKKTYETIKEIDPNLQVLYGGTSHIPLEYIESTFRYGAGEYFDIMNVHPYAWADEPETLTERLRNLNTLMKKFGLENKPVWVTEIGWSTAPQKRPRIYRQILPIAFRKIGIDPKKVPIVFLDKVHSRIMDFKSSFPEFKEWISLPSDRLKNLDPRKYPVLLPVVEEYYDPYHAKELLRYVKRGGTIILPQGVPFNYPRKQLRNDLAEIPYPKLDLKKELGIAMEFPWTHRHPETKQIEIPGIPEKELHHFSNIRFLSGKEMKGEDCFLPLAYGVKGDFRKPFAGIYRYSNGRKGNVIVIAQRADVVHAETTEAMQAEILPRAHLLMFAEGVQKAFWYSFLSGDPESSNEESNFGIVSRERVPKPAYRAYGTLSKMFPKGSTKPVVRIRPDGVYTAKWQRPDGKQVLAVWLPDKTAKCRLPIGEKILETINHLGDPVSVNPADLTVSPGILYFVCEGGN